MRAWVLVLLVGCGSAQSATTPGHEGGGAIGAALEAEIGGGVPVAIVPGSTGLRAISADGHRQRTLVEGPVPWVLVDARSEVVWFGSADSSAIRAIDLRGGGTPETIVSGLPIETESGAPLVEIVYEDASRARDVLTTGHPMDPHVMLVVTDPRLELDGGMLDYSDQRDEIEAQVVEATVDEARLAALVGRGGDRPLELGDTPPTLEKVAGIDPERCDDEEICGSAEAVLPTTLWRVVTEYSCGDGCHVTYTLYDPATKTFVKQPWANLLDDAWVAADGSAFVNDGRVIRFDSGPLSATAVEDSVSGGGWLGGGYYYGY